MSKWTNKTVSYHLTKRIAEHAKAKLEAEQVGRVSSGWKRINYSVKRSSRPIRRWRVVALSG